MEGFKENRIVRRLVLTPRIVKKWLPRSRLSEEGKAVKKKKKIFHQYSEMQIAAFLEVTFCTPHALPYLPREV